MNIRVPRGDTFERVVTVKEAGALVDLTDFAIRSQVRDLRGELALDLTVTKISTGTLTLTASASATAVLAPGIYNCDIEFTDTGDRVLSTQAFQITITEDVTRV